MCNIIVQLTVSSLFFMSMLAHAKDASLSFSFKKVDEHLISRARTYSLNSKKIVLIGMTHVAPGEFYLGVSEYMKKFQNGYRTIILREGLHQCDEKSSYYLKLGEIFDPVKADEIFKKAEHATDFQEDDIANAGFIKIECKRKNFPTPAFMGFLLSPLTTYGRMAMSSRMRSQPGFARLYPQESDLEFGDAALGGMSFTEQMIFAVVSSCFSALVHPEKTTSFKCKQAVDWLNRIPSETVNHAFIDARNIAVVGKTLQQLGLPVPEIYKRKYRFLQEPSLNRGTVILPWGGAHLQDIASMIEAQGFRLQNTFDIPVASCKRVKRSKVLKNVFESICTQ